MFVSDGLGVNESGHLTVGGCDTVSLAKKYGTPYMSYDENMIRKKTLLPEIDTYLPGGNVFFMETSTKCL